MDLSSTAHWKHTQVNKLVPRNIEWILQVVRHMATWQTHVPNKRQLRMLAKIRDVQHTGTLNK